MATTKKTKRSKTKSEPAEGSRSEHPILVGFSNKEHSKLARAAKRSELKICAFVRLAVESAVAEALS